MKIKEKYFYIISNDNFGKNAKFLGRFKHLLP